ncbi:O-antigen ligase family protein [Veillonella intestinalis]|uniref:O-antigen ligase family protein n=1 Tax=Veillonella intestinalis TaxID=2941341 RepID=UPI00203EE4C3|nr:O-antigen ligase family protein [Veillonella intestinalis]
MQKLEYLGRGIFFFLVFIMANSSYNALISNGMGLALLYVCINLWHNKNFELFKFSKLILIGWLIFYGSILASSIVNNDKGSIDIALRYMYWSAPFLLCYYLYRTHPKEYIVQYALIASTLFLGVYALYEKYIIAERIRIEGFYGAPNTYATMLVLVLPFLIAFLFKNVSAKRVFVSILLFISIILSLYAVYLTSSRGAILALGIGGVLTMFIVSIRHRSYIPIIFIVGLMCVLYYLYIGLPTGTNRSYDMERTYFWISSYHMWLDHPWWGIGLNNWTNLYYGQYMLPVAKELNVPHAHNMFVWFFSTTGLIGGLGFVIFTLVLLGYLVRSLWKQPNNLFIIPMFWAFWVLYLQGVVDAGLILKPVSRFFFTLLGLTMASLNKKI